MKKSKVIQFLSAMDQGEFQRLDKYIHSPYFNSHKDTTRLFEYLKKHYPEFKATKVEKQVVFSKLFPKEPFDKDKLHHLNSYLYKQILGFLRQESMQQEWAFQYEHLSLIKALEKKELDHGENEDQLSQAELDLLLGGDGAIPIRTIRKLTEMGKRGG